MGQNKEPIIGFIETKNIIPDILHCFLRVSDKLIGSLRSDLQQMENTFSNNIELNIYFKKYVCFLERIKIRKPYYIGKDNNLHLRDLNGDEKIKLFNQIDFTIFDGLQHQSEKQIIWDKFYILIVDIKDGRLTPDEIRNKATDWFNTYLRTIIDTDNSITPYTHILVSHLYQQAEYLESKGISINSFSMQGLEKQNDFTTTYFHRCSNKKGDVMRQIFTKRCRIEILTYFSETDLLTLLTAPRPVLASVESENDESSDEIER